MKSCSLTFATQMLFRRSGSARFDTFKEYYSPKNIWYDMIYLLTAIGLSPGGSTHLHTNNTRTIPNKQYIEQHNNFRRVRAVPRLG